MTEQTLSHGVLFYTTIYINCILLIVFFITKQWVFLFLILLTFGLTFFMNYVMMNYAGHFKSVGEWMENTLKYAVDNVRSSVTTLISSTVASATSTANTTSTTNTISTTNATN